MKKKLWMVMGLAAMLSLTACGNSEKSGGVSSVVDKIVADAASGNQSGADATGDQSEADAGETQAGADTGENQSAAMTADELIFGTFDNVGNDPNNLWQAGERRSSFPPEKSLAFDDKHIYYEDDEDGVCQINYDGTGKKQLYSGSFHGMNVWNGYLYGIDETIKRIDLSTGTAEDVAGREETEWIDTLLIVDNMMFYVERENQRNIQAHCMNLDTGEDAVVYEAVTKHRAALTTDGTCVYLMTADSEGQNNDAGTWATARAVLDELKNNPDTKFELVVEKDNVGYANGITFTPNGQLRVNTDKKGLDACLYNKIDGAAKCWEKSDEPLVPCTSGDLFDGAASAVVSSNARYVLKGSLVSLVNYVDSSYLSGNPDGYEVYFFPDMNLADGSCLGTVSRDTWQFGAWKDVFYMIEPDEDGVAAQLTSVDAAGTMTSVPIQ